MFIVIVHCCRYSIHYKIQCSNMKSETIHNHTHRRSNTIVPQSFDHLSFGPPNPMNQIMSICSIWFVPPNQMNQMASIWSSIWFDGPNQMDQTAFIWSSIWFGGPNQMDQTTSFCPFEFGGPNQMGGAKCAFGLFHQTKWIKWRPFDPPFGHLVFGPPNTNKPNGIHLIRHLAIWFLGRQKQMAKWQIKWTHLIHLYLAAKWSKTNISMEIK